MIIRLWTAAGRDKQWTSSLFDVASSLRDREFIFRGQPGDEIYIPHTLIIKQGDNIKGEKICCIFISHSISKVKSTSVNFIKCLSSVKLTWWTCLYSEEIWYAEASAWTTIDRFISPPSLPPSPCDTWGTGQPSPRCHDSSWHTYIPTFDQSPSWTNNISGGMRHTCT